MQTQATLTIDLFPDRIVLLKVNAKNARNNEK